MADTKVSSIGDILRHPNFQSSLRMADDKSEEIVQCQYCDGLRPKSEHVQHIMDDCLAFIWARDLNSCETNDDFRNEPQG